MKFYLSKFFEFYNESFFLQKELASDSYMELLLVVTTLNHITALKVPWTIQVI